MDRSHVNFFPRKGVNKIKRVAIVLLLAGAMFFGTSLQANAARNNSHRRCPFGQIPTGFSIAPCMGRQFKHIVFCAAVVPSPCFK